MHGKKNKCVNKNNKRGFTLVELMVVIVIIGILSGGVVVAVFDYIEKAKVTKAKADIRSFMDALRMYKMDHSAYPEKLEDLVVKPTNSSKNWRPYLADISSIPLDPWEGKYLYTKIDNDKYTLQSLGKDKEQDGDGYNADITNENLHSKAE